MKDLTEEKLLEMGFEKVIVPIEESFDDHEYSYFKYDFSKGGGLLTVQCSDEAKDGLYSVELSDIESLGPFHGSDDVQKLINLAKSVDHV